MRYRLFRTISSKGAKGTVSKSYAFIEFFHHSLLFNNLLRGFSKVVDIRKQKINKINN